MRLRSTTLFLLTIALALSACGGGTTTDAGSLDRRPHPLPDGPGTFPPGTPPDDGGGEPPAPTLSGGVLVTVDTGGEIWHWWVTNPVTATYLERAWNGTYSGRFWGRLREGPGAEAHNDPWSWHVDPDSNGHDIVFFAPPIGGPATPSQCENQLAQWLAQDTLFIAYPFTLQAFGDYRN